MIGESCLFQLGKNKRVVWEITKQCSYNCKHCCNNSNNKEPKNEISTTKILGGLSDMKKNEVNQIYFTGGEPLARKDMLSILEYSKIKKIHTKLATNGSTITPAISEKLAQIGLDSVLVSLDSNVPKLNDTFRGIRGAFKNSVKAIQLLTEKGINIRIGTVIWSENINCLEKMIKLGVQYKVETIFFNWLIKSGRVRHNLDVTVDKKRYLKTANKLRLLKKKYRGVIKIGFHRINLITDSTAGCCGGDKLFHLTSEGKISPCPWIAKRDKKFISKKSLKDYSFSELTRDACIKKFRMMVLEREKKFGPGCPAICLSENDNLMSIDPLYIKGGKFVQSG